MNMVLKKKLVAMGRATKVAFGLVDDFRWYSVANDESNFQQLYIVLHQSRF